MKLKSVTSIFQKYLINKIPRKVTNIFYLLFHGTDAGFSQIDTILNTDRREKNILTAQFGSSLRNLAAMNGFEPTMKIPSKGMLKITANHKLFNRVGFPVFVPPYSVFVCLENGLEYFYNGDFVRKITNDICFIPVVEGQAKQQIETSNGSKIERYYIPNSDISENSVSVSVNGILYTQVESFIDNKNLYDNKQFIVKFSSDPQNPIVVYVQNTNVEDIVTISYFITSGEFGNIRNGSKFENNTMINSGGTQITFDEEEMLIEAFSGFDLGSDGTSTTELRAALGFNHGTNMLFDTITYKNFLGKFSTLLVQDVTVNLDVNKQIKNIFVSRKQYVVSYNPQAVIDQYIDIVSKKTYLLNNEELNNLSNELSANEFALSSHVINESVISKYAIQITFSNLLDVNVHEGRLKELIYSEFSKFLYDKYHTINFETLFEQYSIDNKVSFEYTLFNDIIEKEKLRTKTLSKTPYIIKHENTLPLLNGDFEIADQKFNPVKLFFDINTSIVTKES